MFHQERYYLGQPPPFLNGKVLNYNFTTLAAAPYGDHWRNLRRLTAIEVFSASRLNTFASIRREEVKNLLRKKYYGEDVDGLEESKRFKDMMHEFSECTRESEPEYYTDEIIKGIILMMLVAGTKTSALSLEWAFSNLLNNPRALKKAVDEVDTQVGHGRLADEPDFANLHYIQCIIHENLRLCPPAPLLVPHVASERCTLEAMIFHQPERFENGKGEPYRLLPFGLGRRGCPGEAMAFRVINLVMSQLLQCFEFSTVHGEEVDMTETAATLMLKITPLHLVCKARPNTHNLLA
uniref:Cytochrome P450 family protein n=1 Tax=Populus alba TaxID=43335 RepID=A0A4U5MAD5_POPAL|nr:hypothetical protein D5086_0000316270 [Populus alba]